MANVSRGGQLTVTVWKADDGLHHVCVEFSETPTDAARCSMSVDQAQHLVRSLIEAIAKIPEES
jgi:hypothetical protein